jgi:hypothetical protein
VVGSSLLHLEAFELPGRLFEAFADLSTVVFDPYVDGLLVATETFELVGIRVFQEACDLELELFDLDLASDVALFGGFYEWVGVC